MLYIRIWESSGNRGAMSLFTTMLIDANKLYKDFFKSGSTVLLNKTRAISRDFAARGMKFSAPIVRASVPNASEIKLKNSRIGAC